jgi:16S rRNA (cytidine1402-2'-O)-methyltransferase
LILCATPIGNLDDASPRLAAALASADVVYAEDTRRSRVLLERLGVSAVVRSYFVGNERGRSAELGARLEDGETVALITDAGTPAIADPGLSAVRAAVEADAEVTVVPGPSAVTAAVAVSGLPGDRFVFEGFLPRKAGARSRRLEELAHETRTLVLFAAPSRVAEELSAIAGSFGADREVVVVRELTKTHEEIYRGTAETTARRWSEEVEPRGEFTLVVAGARKEETPIDRLLAEVDAGVAKGRSLSAVVREVAETAGVSRRVLYEAALRTRDGA